MRGRWQEEFAYLSPMYYIILLSIAINISNKSGTKNSDMGLLMFSVAELSE